MKIKIMGIGEQPEPALKETPKAIPCPKCQSAMSDCTFYIMPHNFMFKIGQSVERGLVCGACGYTEFYATNPVALITVSERRKKLPKLLNPKNWR